jgi:ABC-type nitrate/sulfonate/bicarbonate transport system substrate-binding protein
MMNFTFVKWLKKNGPKLLVLVVVVGVSAVVLTGCTSSPNAPQSSVVQPATQTVRAAYIPLTANLPLFVALEQGFFKQNGLSVEASEATSPNDIVAALVSGKIDFAPVLAYTIIFPSAIQYLDTFKLFSSSEETETNYTASIIAKKDSLINSYQDLRHKKIGVYGGLVQVNFLKAILTGMKINLDEVEIVEINPRLQIQGLLAGEYDALSTTEPTSNIALLGGQVKLVSDNPRVKYIMNPFPSTAAALSTKFIKENKTAAQAVARSLNQAIDFINSNPTEAKKAMLKYTPIPAESADKVLADLKLFHYAKLGEENRVQVQKFADYLYNNKLLKNKIDVNSLFGDGLLE